MILDRIEADLIHKTLTVYPVIGEDGSLFYPDDSSLTRVKDLLVPWLRLSNNKTKSSEEEMQDMANEYMRRFVLPKMKKTEDNGY